MARYIDVDEAIRISKEDKFVWVYDLTDLEEFLAGVPSADVVPRSAIEKLECRVGKLNEMLNSYALQYGTAIDKEIVLKDVKTKVVREIFTKIESLINRYYHDGWYTVSDMERDVAELKKKYTEGK